MEKKGRYGEFGGQYAAETLMNALINLEEAFNKYKDDEDFNRELNYYHKSDAPSTTNGILCGTTLLFSMPFLLPINIASTRPETPELICTTLPPAKSIEPI